MYDTNHIKYNVLKNILLSSTYLLDKTKMTHIGITFSKKQTISVFILCKIEYYQKKVSKHSIGLNLKPI